MIYFWRFLFAWTTLSIYKNTALEDTGYLQPVIYLAFNHGCSTKKKKKQKIEESAEKISITYHYQSTIIVKYQIFTKPK